MALKQVIAITGCDSGLGWAIAARSAREGLITVAGMYRGTDTPAAKALKKLCVHPYPLDVRDVKSVAGFRDYVMSIVTDNPRSKLYAVVNNAGIMAVGDYEWQTMDMIESAINVNLLGAMRVASAFLPDLRRSFDGSSKPRIINVASHCGLHPLPCLGPYSASKAGVLAWTKALRREHWSHGLTAVAFIPGGFVGSSNIMSNQMALGKAMLENLDEEQKAFYGTRIEALSKYLALSSKDTNFDALKDENIIETFAKALLSENPKELYIVESSWRYKFYYNLLKLPLPEGAQHWLIKKFVNFPQGE